jgi:acyl-CoA synthetase (AMP-forming)/AMP-acid ligase II
VLTTLPTDDRTQWTIPAQLRLRALERPDQVAHSLLDPEGVSPLTFAQWDTASNAAARGLRERGVRPGDRVIVHAATSEWTAYAVAWMAVLKAGAVAVPVSASAGHDQLAKISARARAVCVVAEAEVPLETVRYRVADLVAGQPHEPMAVAVAPGDDAEIIYTSGTTGLPKGVVATHENVLFALMGSRSRTPRSALHSLPPGTTVGQGLLVQPLGPSPHTTLTLPRFAPVDLLEAIERYRPTDVVLVPAMAIALVSAGTRNTHDVSSVRQVRTTSAPIHPATLEGLAQLFPMARIRNVYSTTECWPRRMATDYDRDRPRSLGRPAAGSEVRIVGADGQVAMSGVAGDVQLRSDAPQRRYDGEGSASAVFLDDGWTRTGDIGLLDEDGYFYLVDRNPDLVNTGGLNVSTLEVEAAIMDFPGIVEAAVVGIPHPVLTESVVAAVRARPGLDVNELLVFVRHSQGPAAPQRILVVEDLPRNMLGKVDKRQLRTQLEIAATEYEPPATPTERELAELWATALDLDRVSATDDFLAIGGSSLTAMEVVTAVSQHLGRKVTVRDLLDATTLRAFAQRVDTAVPLDDAVLAGPRG